MIVSDTQFIHSFISLNLKFKNREEKYGYEKLRRIRTTSVISCIFELSMALSVNWTSFVTNNFCVKTHIFAAKKHFLLDNAKVFREKRTHPIIPNVYRVNRLCQYEPKTFSYVDSTVKTKLITILLFTDYFISPIFANKNN